MSGADCSVRSVPAAFDLLQCFIDEPLVVFLREVPLDDLRRDHDGQIDRFAPYLLERATRLELNLPLRILDDVIGFGPRFGADLFTQPIAIGSALRDDRFGLDT